MATRTILEHELAYFAKMSYGDLFRRHAFAYPLQTPKKEDTLFFVSDKNKETKMAKCQKCGKGPGFGNNVSHAQNKTKRKFAANIQKTSVYVNGQRKRMKLCTRCIRTMYKT